MPPPPAKMFGKYELVEELGRGGMAEVWKAKIRGIAGFERTLVIKRVLPQLVRDEEFVAMFVREAQVCSMLNHANIVQVFELGDLDGEYYLAMEYVRGHDLHATLRAKPKELTPPGLAALIGRDICRALGYAHSLHDDDGQPLRIIHRDVSPSNVMLGIDGNIKLVDFGVAKAMALASAGLTASGAVKGKLSYMAPEQITAGAIDHRTDLFAVGIVVHETLTGRRLFKGEHDQQTVERILSAPVFAPSMLNPAVPRELDAVVLRALQRDPQKRFQSGDELAEAFEGCVHALKWGPTQVTQLLRDRFPDDVHGRINAVATSAPALRIGEDATRSGPLFADELSLSDISLSEISPTPRTASHIRALRRSVPFVHAVDEMGAWTVDTDPSLVDSTPELASVPRDEGGGPTRLDGPELGMQIATEPLAAIQPAMERSEDLLPFHPDVPELETEPFVGTGSASAARAATARALLGPLAAEEPSVPAFEPADRVTDEILDPAAATRRWALLLVAVALIGSVAAVVVYLRAPRAVTVEPLASHSPGSTPPPRVSPPATPALTALPAAPPGSVPPIVPAVPDVPPSLAPPARPHHHPHPPSLAKKEEPRPKADPPSSPPVNKPALDHKDVLDPFK